VQKTDNPLARRKSLAEKLQLKRTLKLGTVIILVVIVAATSFIGGTRAETLLGQWGNKQNAGTPETLNFSSVQEVYAKMRNQFDGKLDTQKLIDGAKKGLVAAAGDPYTVYFTNDEAKQFNDDLQGKFSGIGAEIGNKNSNVVVVSTLDDSPARKAGLLTDDIIGKVNDDDTTGWSIDQAVSKIRGDKGTTVKLTIVRGQDVKEVSIVRDNIVNPSVTSQITDANIGYMRISRFAEDTSGLASKAAADFAAHGVKGVILDLRGDGGGYLTAAQDVAGLWVPAGQEVVQQRRGDTVEDTLKAQGTAPLKGVPTIVLVDGGSASASEIVSGALQDHKAAQLLGTKTFGKGSVQQLVDLPLGGQLKVTVAKWYTPNGKNINKQGIVPDIELKPSAEDIAANNDIQKAKAIELLNK
jgi:carboxyl-terminal processing protease